MLVSLWSLGHNSVAAADVNMEGGAIGRTIIREYKKILMTKITGLIAATFAGYNEDGTINLAIITAIVEKMIDDGLSGVFICGTNGEGPNLTVYWSDR